MRLSYFLLITFCFFSYGVSSAADGDPPRFGSDKKRLDQLTVHKDGRLTKPGRIGEAKCSTQDVMNWAHVAAQQIVHELTHEGCDPDWVNFQKVLTALSKKTEKKKNKNNNEVRHWHSLLNCLQKGCLNGVITRETLSEGGHAQLCRAIEQYGCPIERIAELLPQLKCDVGVASAFAPPQPVNPAHLDDSDSDTESVAPVPASRRKTRRIPTRSLSWYQRMLPEAYVTSDHKIRNWIATIISAILVIDLAVNKKKSVLYRAGSVAGSACTRIFRFVTGKNKPKPASAQVTDAELLALGGQLLQSLPPMPTNLAADQLQQDSTSTSIDQDPSEVSDASEVSDPSTQELAQDLAGFPELPGDEEEEVDPGSSPG